MRWRRRGSSDIIDRRGAPGMRGGGFSGPVAIGGGIGLPFLIVLAVVMLLNGGLGGAGTGIDGGSLDDLQGPVDPGAAPLDPSEDPDRRLKAFTGAVVGDAQDFWSDTFAESGRDYRRAGAVLFTGATQSGCGGATSDIGPHYCPADERIYLDLGFFRELRERFGAPGDFAQAYVLAHEVGHHVQHLLGISEQVRSEQSARPDDANELSIRLELQADCLAGVWAFTVYERGDLEAGDLEEGLRAAAAVGDDRLQRQATGRVDRESWTHGSSEQRVRWFRTGYEDGDPNACDTFSEGAV
ncbi:MAG TPA: neutral zinc metallopeptidase [Actinomycetota bacterium]|nr:neutral zinc metallopeptidase [Actinomycetota bacterium]